jgi:hypothetical protein
MMVVKFVNLVFLTFQSLKYFVVAAGRRNENTAVPINVKTNICIGKHYISIYKKQS